MQGELRIDLSQFSFPVETQRKLMNYFPQRAKRRKKTMGPLDGKYLMPPQTQFPAKSPVKKND